jgi:RNA polymerase sigma-70 factor (ECF subfamily)
VRNTAINRLRDLKRHEDKTHTDDVSDLASVLADSTQNIENLMVRKENLKRLNKVIGNLSEKDRELMIRKYFYLQSSKVIANAMQMSVTAIDSRLSRLRTKVKHEFDILI